MARRKRDQKDDHCPEENREHRDRINQSKKEEKSPLFYSNYFSLSASTYQTHHPTIDVLTSHPVVLHHELAS